MAPAPEKDRIATRQTADYEMLLALGSIVVPFVAIRLLSNGQPQSPPRLVWELVSSLVFMSLALLSRPLWHWLGEMRKLFRGSARVDAGVTLALMGAFGFGFYFFVYSFGDAWSGGGGLVVSALMTAAFFGVALPATIGNARVRLALGELFQRGLTPDEVLADFLALRTLAGRFLLVCGIGIALCALPVGAWRRVVETWQPAPQVMLNADVVTLFGLYWSAFLAVGYLPVHFMLNSVGNQISDSVVPARSRRIEDLRSWREKREEIGQLLGLNSDPLDSAKAASIVLAPLLSGVLSGLVSK